MSMLDELEKVTQRYDELQERVVNLLDKYSDAIDEALDQRDEARRFAARGWRGMRNNWLVIQDVRKRLRALPESKLTGESGLAAATMRSHEALERQNDELREEVERLREALEDIMNMEDPDDPEWSANNMAIRARQALE